MKASGAAGGLVWAQWGIGEHGAGTGTLRRALLGMLHAEGSDVTLAQGACCKVDMTAGL